MYADQGDQASELEEQQRQIALANRKPPKPFTGKCYYCKEDIDRGHYCDSYCQSVDEKHERAARFNRH